MKSKIMAMSSKLMNLIKNESGQDLIEYALVVALIAFGATAGMGTLATKINSAFTNIGTQVSTNIT